MSKKDLLSYRRYKINHHLSKVRGSCLNDGDCPSHASQIIGMHWLAFNVNP